MPMVATIQNQLITISPLPLRLMLGFGFLVHGYPKLFTAEGHGSLAGTLSGLQIPIPVLSAYLIGAFEFFGGILLILGVAVRIVSALGVAEMLVAAAAVHAGAGFHFMNVVGVTESGLQYGLPGYEVNLLYLAGFLSLMLSGPGRIALPRLGDGPEPGDEPVQTSGRDRETAHVG